MADQNGRRARLGNLILQIQNSLQALSRIFGLGWKKEFVARVDYRHFRESGAHNINGVCADHMAVRARVDDAQHPKQILRANSVGVETAKKSPLHPCGLNFQIEQQNASGVGYLEAKKISTGGDMNCKVNCEKGLASFAGSDDFTLIPRLEKFLHDTIQPRR